MNNKRRYQYRSILLQRREYILSSIETLKDLSQVKEMSDNLNEKYSNHPADLGSDSLGKEECFMLLSRELKYLKQIDNALKSLDLGTYGICKLCGEEIAYERLKAVPTADTCIKCKTIQMRSIHLN